MAFIPKSMSTTLGLRHAGLALPHEVPAALGRLAYKAMGVFSRRARDAQALYDAGYDSRTDPGETLLVVNGFSGKGQAKDFARDMAIALRGSVESYFTTSVSLQRIMDIKAVLLGHHAKTDGAGLNVVATGGDGTVDETMVAVAKATEVLDGPNGFRVKPQPAGVANDFAIMAGAVDAPRDIKGSLAQSVKVPLFGFHVRYGDIKRSALTFHAATWGSSGAMFQAAMKLREDRTKSGGERITVNDYLRMMPGVIAAAKPFYVSVNGGKVKKVGDLVAVSDMHSLGSVIHAPLPPVLEGGARVFFVKPVPFCLPAIAEAFLRSALLKTGFQAVALTDRLLTMSHIDVPVGESIKLEFFGVDGRHKQLPGTVSGEYFGKTARVELTPKAKPVTLLAGPRSDLLVRKRRVEARWPLGKWFNMYGVPFIKNPRLVAAPALFLGAMAVDLAASAVEGNLSSWDAQVASHYGHLEVNEQDEPQERTILQLGAGPMFELGKIIVQGTLYAGWHTALGIAKDTARLATTVPLKGILDRTFNSA